MIEAIIFDMGGVFFQKSQILRTAVLDQYQVSEDWINQIKLLPAYHLYKQGLLSQDDFMREVGPHLPPGAGHAEDLFRDLSMARDLNQALVDLAASLRTRYRIAVLSNSDSFLEERIERFGIADLFEFVINSYRVRMRKPDQRIFQHLLNRIELDPEQILFVDDKPSNVSVARELGLYGHVFSSTTGLNQDLREHGLLG